jgi:ribose transport system substrate-binding protein
VSCEGPQRFPFFGFSSDQIEVGRLQARQSAAILPRGGTVLYVQGPSENSVAKERMLGMREAKPANIHLVNLKGQWTEESAQRAVRSWLKLTTSQRAVIDLVVAQNNAMATGARKAFQEIPSELERERWVQIPCIGVDGVPKTGQSWVRSGLLAAGQAMELFVEAFQHSKIAGERTLTQPSSIPPLDKLHPR